MISATELTELMENLGHKMTYDKLTKIMAGFDKDHNGSIEFWEFMRMFRSQLLDLQEILDYIKLNPSADAAAVAVAPAVRGPPLPLSLSPAGSIKTQEGETQQKLEEGEGKLSRQGSSLLQLEAGGFC